jgi:hypothetical protein
MLLTACDDMHSHLYDVESASLIEAFSGINWLTWWPDHPRSVQGLVSFNIHSNTLRSLGIRLVAIVQGTSRGC